MGSGCNRVGKAGFGSTGMDRAECPMSAFDPLRSLTPNCITTAWKVSCRSRKGSVAPTVVTRSFRCGEEAH